MIRSLGRCGTALVIGIAVASTSCTTEQQASTAPTEATAAPPRPPLALAPMAGEPAESDAAVPRVQPILQFGSGHLTRSLGGGTGVSRTANDEVSVNFIEADIREVVKSIIGGTLKAPYIVDPRVQGQISMQTGRPVPVADALLLLENALRVNGAALVEKAGTYSVVPLKDAPVTAAVRRIAQDRTMGFGVRILPLHNIGAPEMVKILQPFVPTDRILTADASRMLIIVAGTRQELATVQDLVDTFDVDWLKGMSFGMFPLESVKPSELAKDLGGLFGSDGPMGGLVRFVPVDRLNALLVIAHQPEHLKQVQAWIANLDRADASTNPRLHVYYMQNGSAENLAKTLNSVFGLTRGGSGADQFEVAPGSTPTELRSNGFGQSGRQGTGAGSPTSQLDGGGGPLRPIPTKAAYGAAGNGLMLAMDGPPLSPAQPGAGEIPGAQFPSGLSAGAAGAATPTLRIIADKDKNALVIMASPKDYQMILETVRRLDVPPLQVLIEATIAEVTLNDALNYGVEWFFKTGNNSFKLSNAITGNVAAVPGFSYVLNNGIDVNVVLNALATYTSVKVISSPHLMVLDNQTARLQVGDQVPVATQSAVSVLNPEAPIVNSITLHDTGVIMEVKPRVGAGGNVLMDINQEVSDVVPTTTSTINSPTIQRRDIHSAVAVLDGQSVALGGLILDNRKKGNSGIPFLKDIPFLGILFSDTTDTNARTELLVILTPHVVRNYGEADQATQELRQRMRSIAPLDQQVR